MTLLINTSTEGTARNEVILSYEQNISLDTVTLISGQNLKAGAVLGQITTGSTASAAAFSGNTGNGAMGAITVSAGALEGVYKLVIIEPATDAGKFQVEDPTGKIIGTGAVASAFSKGGLAFTLADGATDFVAGDGFDITVASGSDKYTAHDPDAANGSQVAAAVLLDDADASGGDLKVVAMTRFGAVKNDLVVWKTGISSGNKAAGLAALAAKFIIAR